MRVGDKELINQITFLHRCCLLTLAATTLGLIVRHLLRLDVTVTRQSHHHFATRDQITRIEVGVTRRVDFTATIIVVFGLNFQEIVFDDLTNAFGVGQNVQQIDNVERNVLVLLKNLVLFKARQTLQAHLQNAVSLRFTQVVTLFINVHTEVSVQAFRTEAVHVFTGARQKIGHKSRAPTAAH